MNQAIIDRYIKQPSRLPPDLRRQIEREWKGQPVQLYALADLDHTLSLTECWVALGPRHVTIARRDDDLWELQSFDRSRIEAIQDAPDTGNYYYWRGDTRVRLQAYPEAITDFNRSLELTPQDRPSRVGRGIARLWLGDWIAELS